MSLLLLQGCGSPPKPTTPALDTELAQSLATARTAYNLGAYVQSATLYARALKRAELMDDPAQIANAAYDYAAALIQSNKLPEAAAALIEAEAEATRAKQPVVDILLLKARVARLQGQDEAAVAFADQLLANKAATPLDQVQAWLTKGFAATGDVGSRQDLEHYGLKRAANRSWPYPVYAARVDGNAKAALAHANALLPAQGVPPRIAASLAELQAAVTIASNPFEASRLFDRAADLNRQAHTYVDMRRTLAAAAFTAAAQDSAIAADRAFRAGRSAAATTDQADIAAAAVLFEFAGQEAQVANDASLAARITAAAKSLPTTQPKR